jgi:predicted tellurium resistance membrane protein TerC
MEWLADPKVWMAFLTLTVLEIVLGVDNIVFISILAGKLPRERQAKARQTGLSLAVVTRIIFILSINAIMRLSTPLFTVPILTAEGKPNTITGQELILILGGLFLIAKATYEIHHKLEGEEGKASARVAPTFTAVVTQILIVDLVFSVDSIITAVGMVERNPVHPAYVPLVVMISAVLVSIAFMIAFSGPVSDFVNRHPTVKMLALAFLVLIGVSLLSQRFGYKIPKGYIYFSMAFSVLVEMLNIRAKRVKSEPVRLRQPIT